MKHKYLIIAMLAMSMHISASSWINDADDITEEWLLTAGAETGYTEHVRHFKRLFSEFKIDTLLEFGVGFSTKYFIDNCKNTVSVEFVTPGTGPEWIKYCLELYKNQTLWLPIVYFSGGGLDTDWAPNKFVGTDSVYKAASYQPVQLKSYAVIDSSFIQELNDFISMQVALNKIDVGFVDCGICIRGDLVQALFNKVPIIVAHDIAPKNRRRQDDVYGYGRIEVPSNYEEIYIDSGKGTAFWIIKEDQYSSLRKDLNDYAELFP